MKPATALAALEAHGDPARARGMAAYHKTPRRYFGTPVPDIAVLARGWQHLPPEDQIALAEALWASAAMPSYLSFRPGRPRWEHRRWILSFRVQCPVYCHPHNIGSLIQKA
jgi:hypothetical protein